MLSLLLLALLLAPLLAPFVAHWVRHVARTRDKALLILTILLQWTWVSSWVSSCVALPFLLCAVTLRRLALQFWPGGKASDNHRAVLTKTECRAGKKQAQRLVKTLCKRSRVLQNLRTRERPSWLEWGKDIMVKGNAAYFWLTLALCFAITYSGNLAMLTLSFFIYMWSVHALICVHVLAPRLAVLHNLQGCCKMLCLLLRVVQSARLLYLSLHGDPVAFGASMLMVARAHCQLRISCRVWSMVLVATAQGDCSCHERALWTVLAWSVPLLPPAPSAGDVQVPSVSASSAAEASPHNAAALVFSDVPSLLEAQVQEGSVERPAAQTLLTDIAILQTWRLCPTRETGKAMKLLCNRWCVPRKKKNKEQSLKDLSSDLEQKMLERAGQVLSGNVFGD